MKIPTFDSIDAVPEPFRPFAREADGKVVLDLVPGADVVGLKKRNAELLTEVKTLTTKFDGVDPEEYKQLKETGGKLAQDLDARLKVAAETEASLKSKAEQLETRLKLNAKRAEITRALAATGGSVALLEPVVMQLVDVEEANGDYHVVVRNADGTLRYKDGQGNRFGVTDLLQELKSRDEYKPAFSVTPPSGGGATAHGAGSGGMKAVSIRDERAMAEHLEDIAKGKVKLVG